MWHIKMTKKIAGRINNLPIILTTGGQYQYLQPSLNKCMLIRKKKITFKKIVFLKKNH